jgi:hypothetical protein
MENCKHITVTRHLYVDGFRGFINCIILFNAKTLPIPVYIICMLDSMYETMPISTGLYPKLDLWNTNKLKLQLQYENKVNLYRTNVTYAVTQVKVKFLNNPAWQWT